MIKLFENKAGIIFLAVLFVLSGCAGSQKSKNRISQQPALNTNADSLRTMAKSTEIQKSESINGQYLRVKFRQNDTEVDMVLDPRATNLALDLKRGPDGLVQISRGDSVLFDDDNKKETRPEDILNELEGLRDPANFEKLTDEIIRDISLAQNLFYKQRYGEALNVLKASLQKKKTATAYALGGSIYYVNGDLEQAVLAWENALKINPDMVEVRDLLARYKN